MDSFSEYPPHTLLMPLESPVLVPGWRGRIRPSQWVCAGGGNGELLPCSICSTKSAPLSLTKPGGCSRTNCTLHRTSLNSRTGVLGVCHQGRQGVLTLPSFPNKLLCCAGHDAGGGRGCDQGYGEEGCGHLQGHPVCDEDQKEVNTLVGGK